MTKYHMAVIENRFSTSVRRILDADWEKLKSFFGKHVEVDAKDDVPLFSPWHFFEPKRNSDYVAGTNLWVLDYDGGNFWKTFHWFHDMGYVSLGYTTFSNKDDRQCFRVLVPILSYMGKTCVQQCKKHILSHFPQDGLDKTSLDVARFFYVPSRPKLGGFNNSQHWITSGTPLNGHCLTENYVPPAALAHPFHADLSDNEKMAAVFCLSRCRSLSERGSEPLWFNIACAMACNGFSAQEFYHVSLATWPGQHEQLLRQKWNKAMKQEGFTSYGVIINLIKKDNQYDWYIRMRDSEVS